MAKPQGTGSRACGFLASNHYSVFPPLMRRASRSVSSSSAAADQAKSVGGLNPPSLVKFAVGAGQQRQHAQRRALQPQLEGRDWPRSAASSVPGANTSARRSRGSPAPSRMRRPHRPGHLGGTAACTARPCPAPGCYQEAGPTARATLQRRHLPAIRFTSPFGFCSTNRVSETRSERWNAAARSPAPAGWPAAGRRPATSPSRCRSGAGNAAARRSPAPAGRPAASCTAAPASTRAAPRPRGTRPAGPGPASGTRLVGLAIIGAGHQAPALRGHERLAGDVWLAEPDGRASALQTQAAEELVRVEDRQVSWPSGGSRQSSSAADVCGGGGEAEEQAVCRRRAAAEASAGTGSWPGRRKREVGLAAGWPAGGNGPRRRRPPRSRERAGCAASARPSRSCSAGPGAGGRIR